MGFVARFAGDVQTIWVTIGELFGWLIKYARSIHQKLLKPMIGLTITYDRNL